MKILHTSDWHLGKVFHERSLLEDQRFMLEQVITLIQEDPHDALIIAGDIYDRSIPPAEAVEVFSNFLSRVRHVSNIPICIIPGNHDSATRLSFCAPIMQASGIHIASDPFLIDQPVVIGSGASQCAMYMVPFLHPYTYYSHEEGSERKEKLTHEDAVNEAIARINRRKKDDAINVLVAHLFTAGGLTSDSERAFVGDMSQVDNSLFDGFDYVALGHLHKPQKVKDHIYYSGSPLKYSFSEIGDDKHILSVKLGRKKVNIRAIPLQPLHDMVRLEDTFMNILHNDEFLQFKDHYVEVVLTNSSLVTNPVDALRSRFPHILSVRQNIRSEEITYSPDIPGREQRTLLDDYLLFYKYVYDEKPGQNKISLFEELSVERSECDH